MERSDWFLFLFTFLIGLLAGMYLYAIGFKPVYAPHDGISGDEREASAWSVIGNMYGGGRGMQNYTHPSFRVLANGEYAYIPGGSEANGAEPVEGELPNELRLDLVDAIDDADLSQLEKPMSKTSCRTFVDGVDYTYDIAKEGERYRLDTCRTALEYDDELARVLASIWAYLADADSYEPEADDGSDVSPLGTWLNERFDVTPDDDEKGRDLNGSTECTAEAKICPDGSAVGRTGPNCEFAACPSR